MTIDEFLEELSKLKDVKWHFIGSQIRTDDPVYCECPISVLARKKYGLGAAPGFEEYMNTVYPEVSKKLGLSIEDANKIASSADGDVMYLAYDHQVRGKLLQATGLESQ